MTRRRSPPPNDDHITITPPEDPPVEIELEVSEVEILPIASDSDEDDHIEPMQVFTPEEDPTGLASHPETFESCDEISGPEDFSDDSNSDDDDDDDDDDDGDNRDNGDDSQVDDSQLDDIWGINDPPPERIVADAILALFHNGNLGVNQIVTNQRDDDDENDVTANSASERHADNAASDETAPAGNRDDGTSDYDADTSEDEGYTSDGADSDSSDDVPLARFRLMATALRNQTARSNASNPRTVPHANAASSSSDASSDDVPLAHRLTTAVPGNVSRHYDPSSRVTVPIPDAFDDDSGDEGLGYHSAPEESKGNVNLYDMFLPENGGGKTLAALCVQETTATAEIVIPTSDPEYWLKPCVTTISRAVVDGAVQRARAKATFTFQRAVEMSAQESYEALEKDIKRLAGALHSGIPSPDSDDDCYDFLRAIAGGRAKCILHISPLGTGQRPTTWAATYTAYQRMGWRLDSNDLDRLQLLFGIGPMLTVPMVYWSHPREFVVAAETLATFYYLMTPADARRAVYKATAELRTQVSDEWQGFAGYLPIRYRLFEDEERNNWETMHLRNHTDAAYIPGLFHDLIFGNLHRYDGDTLLPCEGHFSGRLYEDEVDDETDYSEYSDEDEDEIDEPEEDWETIYGDDDDDDEVEEAVREPLSLPYDHTDDTIDVAEYAIDEAPFMTPTSVN